MNASKYHDLTLMLAAGLVEATTKHPEPFHSAHEAYGIITEEYREFESEVFKKEAERDPRAMLHELVHVMTTAARAIHDLGLVALIEEGDRGR